MTVNQQQDLIIEEFSGLDDWMDRYAYIIELGNALPPLPETDKVPDNLIDGCQSRVWLTAEKQADGTLIFRADSDAIIVKGIIALLLNVLSGHTPDDILNADLYFIKRIGLQDNLSPTRSNGLAAMVRLIRAYAFTYSQTATTQS